jgi:hypothetical protein
MGAISQVATALACLASGWLPVDEQTPKQTPKAVTLVARSVTYVVLSD